ncbi:MAG: S-layer homology domain-containing protein [Peptococcaceae bacterium]|nr:S-layer homology domain-containing protein [Peptococcaceae bacterium]
MKKLKLFALAAMLILVAALPAVATTPSDISGHWGAQYINQAVSSGIVKGYPDGTFKPENSITRAEFVTMLARVPESGTTVVYGATDVQGFSDAKGHWAAPYLAWAVKEGVLKGFENNTLRPDDTVTREQVAAILGRKTPDAPKALDLPYADGFRISAWALDGVGILYQAGVMRGDERGFRSQDKLTRAEAAKVLVEWRKWRATFGQQSAPAGWKWNDNGYMLPDKNGPVINQELTMKYASGILWTKAGLEIDTYEGRDNSNNVDLEFLIMPPDYKGSWEAYDQAKKILASKFGDDFASQVMDYVRQKKSRRDMIGTPRKIVYAPNGQEVDIGFGEGTQITVYNLSN